MSIYTYNVHKQQKAISFQRVSGVTGLATAMPGFHAFTSSDFTTAFYRKGKINPLEVLEKDTEGTLIQFFSILVSEE